MSSSKVSPAEPPLTHVTSVGVDSDEQNPADSGFVNFEKPTRSRAGSRPSLLAVGNLGRRKRTSSQGYMCRPDSRESSIETMHDDAIDRDLALDLRLRAASLAVPLVGAVLGSLSAALGGISQGALTFRVFAGAVSGLCTLLLFIGVNKSTVVAGGVTAALALVQWQLAVRHSSWTLTGCIEVDTCCPPPGPRPCFRESLAIYRSSRACLNLTGVAAGRCVSTRRVDRPRGGGGGGGGCSLQRHAVAARLSRGIRRHLCVYCAGLRLLRGNSWHDSAWYDFSQDFRGAIVV